MDKKQYGSEEKLGFPMINSIKVKILGLVSVIVIVIISGTSYFNYRQQQHVLFQSTERNNQILTKTIRSSVADAMRSGHSEEVANILSRLKTEEIIKSLRIVAESGKVLNSADSKEVGSMIPPNELLELKASGGKGIPLHLSEEDRVYDSYTPIINDPTCQGCHSPSQKILGYLETELSTDYVNEFLGSQKTSSIISTAIIIFLTIIAISIFLIYYIDTPIRALINAMQRVENGEFDNTLIIKSSNEMRLLSENFKRMVDRLKKLLDTTIVHERELAIAQEKIDHHIEIHGMNSRLEEQLREIENLNIDLEERIEEIEEANYKIADLAGELEDKNTNLETAVSRLSTLYKVGLAINSTMELDRLFKLIINNTLETLHAQIGYILLYNADAESFDVTTLVGYDAPKGQKALQIKPTSVSGWVVKNRKPLLISDINSAPQFDRFSALGYERKTLICAPLLSKDEIIGTITVVNKQDDTTYSSDELELLTTIAAQASIAISNAKLYDIQQKTYLNTIHALVSAIEASDSYTRGHSERVTRYSIALGQKLNLPEDRIKVLERAAILHDIGKIGINISLLHKQGMLTQEDVSQLQQHPAIGMKILEPIDFLNDVRTCIGQHHERFDGRGYPCNLPANKQLLESRILAISDSFDAMTSDRPYRKALSLDTAIRELLDNAGSQFDPTLVPHFIELLESGAIFNLQSFDEKSSDPAHIAATLRA
jgi:HD-GYP domain-containing protein (c-di-GMP phosphodiesterase class II)